MNKIPLLGITAAFGLAGIASASAHVTLSVKQASAGGGYMAIFRIPHGCSGAATTAVRIRIPPGVFGVKPMPKAGWTVEVQTGRYDKPLGNRGQTLTEGVTQVSWTGGNLPDALDDEFTLSTSLADSLPKDSIVCFPVVQQCENGAVERWIVVPSSATDELAYPAPGVRIAP